MERRRSVDSASGIGVLEEFVYYSDQCVEVKGLGHCPDRTEEAGVLEELQISKLTAAR